MFGNWLFVCVNIYWVSLPSSLSIRAFLSIARQLQFCYRCWRLSVSQTFFIDEWKSGIIQQNGVLSRKKNGKKNRKKRKEKKLPHHHSCHYYNLFGMDEGFFTCSVSFPRLLVVDTVTEAFIVIYEVEVVTSLPTRVLVYIYIYINILSWQRTWGKTYT